MRLNHLLMNGTVDKNLRMNFIYDFKQGGDERFPTMIEHEDGNLYMFPAHSISISSGNNNHIFIPTKRYFQFVTLLERSAHLISEHLFELFPNISMTEFDIDHKVMERFETEQKLTTDGMSMVPAIWVNENNECFPAIRYEYIKGDKFTIPLNDAIPMIQILNTLDPFTFGLSLLRIRGVIR